MNYYHRFIFILPHISNLSDESKFVRLFQDFILFYFIWCFVMLSLRGRVFAVFLCTLIALNIYVYLEHRSARVNYEREKQIYQNTLNLATYVSNKWEFFLKKSCLIDVASHKLPHEHHTFQFIGRDDDFFLI